MECGACSRNCPAEAISVKAGVGCAAAVIGAMLGRTDQPCCGSADCGCSSPVREEEGRVLRVAPRLALVEFLPYRLADRFHEVGFPNVRPDAKRLRLGDPLRFREAAYDDSLLARVDFKDRPIGIETVHRLTHDHVENDEVGLMCLEEGNGLFAAGDGRNPIAEPFEHLRRKLSLFLHIVHHEKKFSPAHGRRPEIAVAGGS